MRQLNLQPTLKGDAMLAVEVLTADCEAIAKRIVEPQPDQMRRGLIAKFEELNETRCRIIEQFDLQAFAEYLIS